MKRDYTSRIQTPQGRERKKAKRNSEQNEGPKNKLNKAKENQTQR